MWLRLQRSLVIVARNQETIKFHKESVISPKVQKGGLFRPEQIMVRAFTAQTSIKCTFQTISQPSTEASSRILTQSSLLKALLRLQKMIKAAICSLSVMEAQPIDREILYPTFLSECPRMPHSKSKTKMKSKIKTTRILNS